VCVPDVSVPGEAEEPGEVEKEEITEQAGFDWTMIITIAIVLLAVIAAGMFKMGFFGSLAGKSVKKKK
jgi:hypothetical protein